ncbi:recombinase family protein [Agarivorans sp. B2Z047]|uniref:recombinase family protein n=1 Tax=Agarivorans sp. B2Z047 TaxID=2652721 RepID=UPI00201A0414|nr:recombinase family protein [Agarivorans sp. B2Z047]UQN42522.1 recombinase family protein [Agarivorans sp. B2Z047]
MDTIFEDKVSGSTTDRPGLNQLLSHVRSGDVVHVHDISRLARNTGHLLELVEHLLSAGVTITFHKEQQMFSADNANPMNQLMLTMLGAIYQFERSLILERQREGIAIAKKRGVYNGRKRSIDTHKVKVLRESGMSYRKIAQELSISLSSVQRALKA